MADGKTVDKDGSWFCNTAQFRFAHGERDGVIFEPGIPTKVKPDAWIKGQPLLATMEDPDDEPPAQIEVETPLNAGLMFKEEVKSKGKVK